MMLNKRGMVTWIALLGAGALCGFLNVAASSGSAITLPLLIALGLPPAIANGTNRLPVLVGMASAIWRFQKSKAIPWPFCLRLLPVFVISALVGAQMAAMLPMERIRVLVHIAVVLALVDVDPGNQSRVNESPHPVQITQPTWHLRRGLVAGPG